MNAAMAMPGNTAATFLVHFFGSGLADDRYVVERFNAHADGDIRPWPGEAPGKGKGRRAKHVTATLKAVREMRPARTEIIVCTGLRTRGGQQLTGCRRSEVLDVRWRDIGADAIALEDSKTGPRAVPLGEAARALIEALPGARDPDSFLFPRYAEARGQSSLIACWRAVGANAKLSSLRLHDLRHTAASQAVMSGEGLPLVGRLLGHSRHRTTAGYAHLADAHLVEAAEKVGSIIAEAMEFEVRLR